MHVAAFVCSCVFGHQPAVFLCLTLTSCHSNRDSNEEEEARPDDGPSDDDIAMSHSSDEEDGGSSTSSKGDHEQPEEKEVRRRRWQIYDYPFLFMFRWLFVFKPTSLPGVMFDVHFNVILYFIRECHIEKAYSIAFSSEPWSRQEHTKAWMNKNNETGIEERKETGGGGGGYNGIIKSNWYEKWSIWLKQIFLSRYIFMSLTCLKQFKTKFHDSLQVITCWGGRYL